MMSTNCSPWSMRFLQSPGRSGVRENGRTNSKGIGRMIRKPTVRPFVNGGLSRSWQNGGHRMEAVWENIAGRWNARCRGCIRTVDSGCDMTNPRISIKRS